MCVSMTRLQEYQIPRGPLAFAILQIATKRFRAAALLFSCILQQHPLKVLHTFFLIIFTIQMFPLLYTEWRKVTWHSCLGAEGTYQVIFSTVCVRQLMNLSDIEFSRL
jgi:hypothetical protein